MRDHKVIIENATISLYYYPATKIVHHEFRRFTQGENFRSVLEQGLEIFKTHNACKWLSDDRGNTAITPADAEWALTNWAPRVIAAGWKYWAVVLPENTIGQMNMRRWLKTYADRGVTAEVFSNPRQALLWLEMEEPAAVIAAST
jgi:hypothetical protein